MPPFDAQRHSPVQSLNRFAEGKIGQALDLLAKSVPCSVDSVDSTGTIVVVKVEIQQPEIVFPLIKCPVYGPEWVRWPIQKGDRGVMFSADYYIGGMSGLGTGVADLTPQFNFSTGVFFPIGNTNFSDTDDPKKVVLYGPEGVILKGCNDDAQHKDTTDPEAPPSPTQRLNVPAAAEQCGKLDVNKNDVELSFGDETRMVTDETGFKFYIGGTLKFIIDAGGARFIGGPMPGGGDFGINVTPAGTFVDGVNFLPHQHVGVTTGTGNTGSVDDTP
jgi:hypothetical protein